MSAALHDSVAVNAALWQRRYKFLIMIMQLFQRLHRKFKTTCNLLYYCVPPLFATVTVWTLATAEAAFIGVEVSAVDAFFDLICQRDKAIKLIIRP